MERNTLRYFIMLFIFTFAATVAFTSCNKDDEDSGKDSSTEVSDSKNWYFYEDRDGFNNVEANTDYNSNKHKYYNYVDDNGYIKGGYGRTCIHFLNNNTLEYWYFTLGVEGCKPSLSSQYYCKTPYYLGNDNFIYFSSSHFVYSYVEVDGKIIVTNGDIYTRTSNGIIKDDTSQVLQKGTVYTSNFSKEKQIADACTKISVNKSCDYNDLSCNLNFNSVLGSIYPNESFVYGVEYGINICETTIESESRSNPVTMNFEMLDKAKHPYVAVILKLENNGVLTSSETSFYNQWYKSIKDMMSRGNHNFVTKCYVRYSGTKYYIER